VISAACNSHFQGLVADIAKEALYLVSRECYVEPTSPLFGYRPVFFVHDEIDIEGPLDGLAEAGERMREIALEVACRWAPAVPWEGDVALALRLYKGAKEVRDESGRLVVWRPEA